eukprot:360684-Chlamydomonas_euryale.AAC.2
MPTTASCLPSAARQLLLANRRTKRTVSQPLHPGCCPLSPSAARPPMPAVRVSPTTAPHFAPVALSTVLTRCRSPTAICRKHGMLVENDDGSVRRYLETQAQEQQQQACCAGVDSAAAAPAAARGTAAGTLTLVGTKLEQGEPTRTHSTRLNIIVIVQAGNRRSTSILGCGPLQQYLIGCGPLQQYLIGCDPVAQQTPSQQAGLGKRGVAQDFSERQLLCGSVPSAA